MLSINIYLRFALIGVFLGGGIVLALVYSFWYAFPLILIGLVLLAGYIFLGTIQSAGEMLQQADFDGAEQRLNLTWKPEWLYKTNRAFYYMLKGTLAGQRKNNEEAEMWLTKAQKVELPSDNEKAMVLLQLANIHATKNNWNKAKIYLSQIKKLKVTETQIKDQIKQFDKVFSNRGQMRHAQGMRGRKGGFRRKKF